MKRVVLLLCCALFTTYSHAQYAAFQWAKSMGDTSDDVGNFIIADAAGNSYTTGSFQGTVDFDPGAGTFNLTAVGESDVFILKLDAAGNFVWAKQIGGAGNDVGANMALDAAGNIYVAGSFFAMVDFDPGPGTTYLSTSGGYGKFILKLDAGGNYVWAKTIEMYIGDGTLAVDASANVYLAGNFMRTVDFDPGPATFNLTAIGSSSDIEAGYVLKLDPSGNFLWVRKIDTDTIYSSSFGSPIRSITLDRSGNPCLVGHFDQRTVFGTDTLHPVVSGALDGFISKLDSNGNFTWIKQIDGRIVDPMHIVLDQSSNIYTLGYFTGIMSFNTDTGMVSVYSTRETMPFIAKFDTGGNFIWEKNIGDITARTIFNKVYVFGKSIQVDHSGNVYAVGYFDTTADFDPGPAVFNLIPVGGTDVFISKLDSSGNFVWAKGYGGTGDDLPFSVALDHADNIYTTGYFNNTVDFDPGSHVYNLSAAGNRDIFIQKMSPTKTGIKNVSLPVDVSIYPNPTREGYELQYKVQGNGALQLSISDITGRLMLKADLPTQQNTYHIDASDWTVGMYLYRISRNGATAITGKLIKN